MGVELYPEGGTWELLAITHRPSEIDVHTPEVSIVVQLYWSCQPQSPILISRVTFLKGKEGTDAST